MAPIPHQPKDWEHAERGDAERKTSHPTRSPPRVSPRNLIVGVVLFLVGLNFLQDPISHCYQTISDHICGPKTVEQRVRRILSSTPLIDGHIDLAILLREKYKNQIDNEEWKAAFENGTLAGDVDLKRLRDGQSGGAFWSVWIPCPKDASDLTDESVKDGVQYTLDQIDLMARLQDLYSDSFTRSQGLTSHDAYKAWKNEGKFISPMGIEGLHQIGNRISTLRRYHELGVRYATLTHNCHNKYADAAQEEFPLRVAEPIFHGVSKDGRKLIHEMNRIGMIVDISHVSEETMVDVLGGKDGWEGSKAPVMFSHSSVHAICPHPRNVKDHVLDMVKERNSVVLINIAGQFIACKDVGADNGVPEPIPEENTMGRVAEHIMYIGDRIGYDHVGIGTDLDGIPDHPEGFADVTNYPDLVAELLRRGVSDADAGKVVGENVLRVWHDVEVVAAKMQAAGTPAYEEAEEYDGPY